MNIEVIFNCSIEREYWINRFEHAEKTGVMFPEDYADEKLTLFRFRNKNIFEIQLEKLRKINQDEFTNDNP